MHASNDRATICDEHQHCDCSDIDHSKESASDLSRMLAAATALAQQDSILVRVGLFSGIPFRIDPDRDRLSVVPAAG